MSTSSILVAALVIPCCAGCSSEAPASPEPTAVEIQGQTMGTSYSIKCWSDSDQIGQTDKATLKTAIDTLLKEINQQMSTYLPDSELSTFNAATAKDWFAVSPNAAYVVQQAIHYHQLTGGASDVTVGPLVKLWNFGPGRQPFGAKVPSPTEEQLEETLAQTGGEHLEARIDPPALRKSIARLEVDLSSIAKGYAVDAIIELLGQLGMNHAMVEIGGEVRATGLRPDGTTWKIGIETPATAQSPLYQVVALRNLAMATSGDYRNYRQTNDEKFSHIIDPRTGRPLAYRGCSVTVLAKTCLEADALATALLVMGDTKAYNWCVEHNIAALFLLRKDDETIEQSTPHFRQLTAVDSLPNTKTVK